MSFSVCAPASHRDEAIQSLSILIYQQKKKKNVFLSFEFSLTNIFRDRNDECRGFIISKVNTGRFNVVK